MRWYNCTTFDFIADLAYGEELHGLAEVKSNMWIDNIENLMKLMSIFGFSDNFAETLESSYSLWQGLRSESLRLSTDKRDPEGRSMRLQRLN